MEPPLTGPVPAVCAHSHLFRGARVLLPELPDPAGFAARTEPVALRLRLGDGVETAAELLVGDNGDSGDSGDSGDMVLDVAAYVTAAGTALTRRTWFVRELSVVGAAADGSYGAAVEVRIGTSAP